MELAKNLTQIPLWFNRPTLVAIYPAKQQDFRQQELIISMFLPNWLYTSGNNKNRFRVWTFFFFCNGFPQPLIIGLCFEIAKESFHFSSTLHIFILSFFQFSHTPACHWAETARMQLSKVCVAKELQFHLIRINIFFANMWVQHTGIFKYTYCCSAEELAEMVCRLN